METRLLRRVGVCLLGFCLVLPAFATPPKTRRAAGKSHTATSSTARRATGKSHTAAASTARRSSAKTGKGRKYARNRSKTKKTSVQTWRTGQMVPTPARYKEIQAALVSKGYSSQAADGVWGPQWSESLRKFQQDQKLEPSGKLSSLSLITLGLGPRREAPGSPAPAHPPGNPPPPETREN